MAIDTSILERSAESETFDITIKDSTMKQDEEANAHAGDGTPMEPDVQNMAKHSSEDVAAADSENKDKLESEKKEPTVEPGTISSAHTIYRVKDENGDYIWTSEYPKDVAEAAENEETAKFAVLVRSIRSDDPRKKLEAESISIQSSRLRTALGEVLLDYPGVSCELQRLEFEAPFKPFMHKWSELLAYAEKDDLDSTTKDHLTVLIGILKEELRDDIKAFEDYVSKGITTYTHAWMVFKPGELVIGDSCGPLSAYEFVRAEYISENGRDYLQLKCMTVDWNGDEFGRLTQYISIPRFQGTEKITNLTIYPMSFCEDEEAVRSTLVARGKKFESLAGYHFKSYNGTAVSWDDEGREVGIHHSGRIIIDCKSFNRYAPYSRRYTKDFKQKDMKHLTPKQRSKISTNPLNPESKGVGVPEFELSDYLLLLCYSRVRGYSLSLKKWLDFYVQLIDEITWSNRAFDSLVLPEDQKELILAITESQIENRRGFDDVVQGKGQGIVILLSGKPGIGKTLTAESVAETMRLPLHTISSGDLGTNSWDVEQKLVTILDMVGRWNAVLLLDECDVFLEARANHDLDRNAMVSTFLRVLEYYNGILFMTTNRADNIDSAFESRIHVSMQYPDLNTDSRKRIWSNFLEKQDHALEDDDLEELADIELNGRQIKNILKTSHLLASRKKQKLSMRDISTVLDIENRRPEKKHMVL